MRGDRKSSQRARLIAAMRDLSLSEGYQRVSIARVVKRAGVSRPTFYDYFEGKDDCLLAASSEAQDDLVEELSELVRTSTPERALAAAIDGLVGWVESDREAARLWLIESMGGGELLLAARDQAVARIGELVEGRYALASADARIPDISPQMLIGGACRLLARQLEHEEASFAEPSEQLLAWTRRYERPLGEHRWRKLEPERTPPGPSLGAPLRAPIAIPTTSSRHSREELEHNQRQRVLFAAAQIAERKGYAAATVARITSRAGVDTHAFQRLFATRQHVFAEINELYFQHLIAITARGFALGKSWPEQVWHGTRGSAQFVHENPAFTHIAFVEAHAAGPAALRRGHELVLAFTVFLQEGLRELPPGRPRPSGVALEMIALTNFETIYQRSRESRLAGLAPHITYHALAPFLGAEPATELIDRLLREAEEAQ